MFYLWRVQNAESGLFYTNASYGCPKFDRNGKYYKTRAGAIAVQNKFGSKYPLARIKYKVEPVQ